MSVVGKAERKAMIASLRRAGFERAWRSAARSCYVLRIGARSLEVQLWDDGRHRASHMLWRPLPDGGEGGRMSTFPTDFTTLEAMWRAIFREVTRTDHLPDAPQSPVRADLSEERPF